MKTYEVNNMQLYVWENPINIRYGESLVFAIAPSLREARKVAANGESWPPEEFNQDTIKHFKLGKPTRVVQLPCAEWHSWEE